MDSKDLSLTFDYLGSSGIVLSPERKAALQTSLLILKNENKAESVKLWGKIIGIKEDYYVAQCVGKDEIQDRTTFYSKDCVHWGLLPRATEAVREKSKLAKGRFTGDPSNEFEHVEMKKIPGADGDELQEEEETIVIKEEDRLASVIEEVTDDAYIVPRGAYVKTPTGTIYKNRTFEGLSLAASAKLYSYFHFRDAVLINEKNFIERANLDKAIDFLDSIESDIPRGCWSLQFEQGSGLVTLRSLLWPGYVFYHVPGTTRFGSLYVGTGEINKDLPFML